MALFRPSAIVSEIVGSAGANTFQRNRAGRIIRNRTNPTQPASAFRDVIWASTSALATYWGSTLTEAQRQAWRDWTSNFTFPNKLGELRKSTGFHQFMRHNSLFKIGFDTIPIIAPPTGIPNIITAASLTPVTGASTFDVTINFTLRDTPNTDSLMFIQVGKFSSAGKTRYWTPFQQLVFDFYGEGSGWNYNTQSLSLPGWCGSGTRLWSRWTFQDHSTGQISNTFKLFEDLDA